MVRILEIPGESCTALPRFPGPIANLNGLGTAAVGHGHSLVQLWNHQSGADLRGRSRHLPATEDIFRRRSRFGRLGVTDVSGEDVEPTRPYGELRRLIGTAFCESLEPNLLISGRRVSGVLTGGESRRHLVIGREPAIAELRYPD